MPYQFNVPEGIVQDVYAGRKGIDAYSPYLSLLHNEHIIGVNMAYQLGDWVDICFFGDYGFFKKQKKGLSQFTGMTATCAKGVDVSWVKYLHKNRRKDYGITYAPGQISWNRNSGASAINLAVHLGVKQIILLGFDMRLDEGKNQHWHKCYTTNIKTVGHSLQAHLKGFPAIAEDLKKENIEVLNASPHSKIQEFKKLTIRECLK